jgi:hypothetical protein
MRSLEAIAENAQLIDLKKFKLIVQEFQKYEAEDKELEILFQIFEKCFEKFEDPELQFTLQILEKGSQGFHLNYETINFTKKFTGPGPEKTEVFLREVA